MPRTVSRDGLPVVNLERSLVDAWTSLRPIRRRGPVIDAIRNRLTTPARVGAALAARPNIHAASELRHLLRLLEHGCHSELEIWGLQRVFVIPGIPLPQHQIRVAAEARVAHLDVGWPDVLLGLELDGAAAHTGRAQRERDLRRDAWLATCGWLILRYSYRRLIAEPVAVRAEIAAAYRIRLHQAAIGSA